MPKPSKPSDTFPTNLKEISKEISVCIRSDTKITTVLKMIRSLETPAALVYDLGAQKPSGVITSTDIANAITEKTDIENTLVGDLITNEMPSVSEEASIHEAYALIAKRDADYVLVSDSNNHPKGLINNDLLMFCATAILKIKADGRLDQTNHSPLTKPRHELNRKPDTTSSALAMLLEKSSIGIWLSDNEANTTLSNSAFRRLVSHLSPKDKGSQGEPSDMMSLSLKNRWRQSDISCMEGQRFTIEKTTHELTDGSQRHLTTSRICLLNDQYDHVGMIGFTMDVTDQAESERKLIQEETIRDCLHEGVLIVKPNGTISSVNTAFCSMTGFTGKELINRAIDFLSGDNNVPQTHNHAWLNKETRDTWSGKIMGRRKDGTLIPLNFTINSIRDCDGQITEYIGVYTDISKIIEAQERLRHQAYHDPLTNLPNQFLFQQRLSRAIARGNRYSSKAAVLFIDIDHFKRINDSLGHDIGDKVLQSVAERLNSVFREEDTLARFGGDEFVAIVERIKNNLDAESVAKKIMCCLQEGFCIDEHELHISSSIGIAIFPNDGKDSKNLIKNADTAMYKAKNQGRDNFCFYTEDISRAAIENLKLEQDLRKALERGEFTLYYQPKVNTKLRTLIGLEALIRWNHPSEGIISPAKFLPVAETSGLIIKIGEWIIETACKQAKEWIDSGVKFGRISINISGQQIEYSNLLSTIKGALKKSNLHPRHLELEVLENLVMHNVKSSISLFNAIRQMGIKISIDDFGTGHSSLSHLKNLPIDRLKIDKSFVDGLPNKKKDIAIARSIVGLAKALEVSVLAEGIERQEQVNQLLDIGCENFQGFYFSKPKPANELFINGLVRLAHPL